MSDSHGTNNYLDKAETGKTREKLKTGQPGQAPGIGSSVPETAYNVFKKQTAARWREDSRPESR